MPARRSLAAAMLVLMALAACTGVPDANLPRADSMPPGRGLFTGEKGAVVIGLPP